MHWSPQILPRNPGEKGKQQLFPTMPKVLLIEDDKIMTSLLKTLLEIEGFQAGEFNGQEQAFLEAAIDQEKPDLILLDVHLRRMNGFDILQRIRTSQKYRGIKVLMTSGMDVRGKCLESGADGFILKPYMPDDLIRIIQKALST
jgi:CheY-like chemotaxis protein